ncbi:hypothetical protein [Mycobacterium stomatepiae]|uniref:Uncharacterized protein n=1 Tax=Mycobacterium stomatepiae TaxID=470076 RepID=A0A7I7QDM7_9MYCO|nr:hypothetical protein [Mycobacterium stomatepiae]MCV7164980.1 hypothetical protein [Mycobacterium stomatepiae]BBY24147.1 hypothetical protein MSTO_43520 [Mycobacterium stomatepiae]
MFTLLVSWLLVACVPGLLMLAALGLGRLEKELARESITSTDVDEFLEQAQAMDMHTLAREGMPEALEYLHRRQAQQLALSAPPSGRHRAESLLATAFTDPPARAMPMPMRIHAHSAANPQYEATRHVNRV